MVVKRRLGILLFVLFLICFLLPVIYLWSYFLIGSETAERLGVLADYFTALSNPLLNLANIAVFFYITLKVHDLGESREKEREERRGEQERLLLGREQRANAIGLIDRFQSVDHYRNVSLPVWEIAVKWHHWQGEDGARYRADVVYGFGVGRLESFVDPMDCWRVNRELVRFGGHFDFKRYFLYDSMTVFAGECVQSDLTEHQSLTIWMEYWGALCLMIEAKYVDSEMVGDVLADWYFYWVDFMIEFREVLRIFLKERQDWGSGADNIFPGWLEETERLENYFFSRKYKENYKNKLLKGKQRASQIAEEIRPVLMQFGANNVQKRL